MVLVRASSDPSTLAMTSETSHAFGPRVVKLVHLLFLLPGPRSVLPTCPPRTGPLSSLPEELALPLCLRGFFEVVHLPAIVSSCLCSLAAPVGAKPLQEGALSGRWPSGPGAVGAQHSARAPTALRGDQSCSRFAHPALLPTAHLFPDTGDTALCSLQMLTSNV